MATHTQRILHIVEGSGGGLADAIISYAASVPDAEHHIRFSLRPGISIEPGAYDGFASAELLPTQHLAAVRATRRAVRELEPCVVHAHSSYAGVYTRVGVDPRRTPIVYTPHCFSIERRDISPAAQRAYVWAERMLARRTTEFAACSPREAQLAAQLDERALTSVVVNVARLDGFRPSACPAPAMRPTISMSGRLAPQKGAGTFVTLARALRAARVDAHLLWIGGGDPSLAEPLREAGVEVTGWIDHDEVLMHIASSDLYVHTSEWEGFPIALLEAVGLGVPALALRRGYTVGLPEIMLADDDQLSARVTALISDPTARAELLSAGRTALAHHTRAEQSRRLRTIYDRWDPHLPGTARASAPIPGEEG